MRYKLFFILILLIPWVSCKQKKAEKETLKDDFELIKERKELTILTLYSSTSYFLYKGEEMGYEYELIKQFAEDNGLKLKVIVAENIGKLIEMLKAGMAWHFSKYDDTLEYEEAEENSRIRKIGLWADPQRIAPWDFRKK